MNILPGNQERPTVNAGSAVGRRRKRRKEKWTAEERSLRAGNIVAGPIAITYFE